MALDSMVTRYARFGDRGQVLPLVAISLVVLLGAAALAVDIGYLRFQQRAQQIATDSAAIAGANELTYTPATRVTSGARMDATSNGYTDGAASVTVTVNHPPASGAYNGLASAVEVIITKKNLSLFFGGVLNAATPQVTTRAVAAVNPNELGCVYALDPAGNLTLNGGGGGGINAPTCGIATNGNLNVNGQANVNARFIGYRGTGPSGGSYPEGQPTKVSIPVADPCAKFTSCAYLTSLAVNTLPCKDATPQPSNALPPGRYCHPVSGDVTFAPTVVNGVANALYIFDSAVPTGNMSGTGVTIYNNSGSGITWSGNNTVFVKAPTSGSTSGMAYFQPKTNSGAITKNGQAGSVDFQGGFYAPSASVTMNGNLPSVSLFVAGTIVMNGSGMTVAGSAGLVQTGHAVLAE